MFDIRRETAKTKMTYPKKTVFYKIQYQSNKSGKTFTDNASKILVEYSAVSN